MMLSSLEELVGKGWDGIVGRAGYDLLGVDKIKL